MREQMMLDGFLPHEDETYRMRLLLADVAMAEARLNQARAKLASERQAADQVTIAQWLKAQDDLANEATARFG